MAQWDLHGCLMTCPSSTQVLKLSPWWVEPSFFNLEEDQESKVRIKAS
jgi:hypothetical protein